MEVRRILITDERKHALKKAELRAFDIAICVPESVGGGEFVYVSDPKTIAALDRENGFTRSDHICDVAVFSTMMGEISLILRLETILGRIERTYEMLYEDGRHDDGEDDFRSFSIGSV